MSFMASTADGHASQVDFYLIHLTVGVPGFTMRWTVPPPVPAGGDRHCGSDLRVLQEFSAVLTSSAATDAIQWEFSVA
jgi:hypothetical protein